MSKKYEESSSSPTSDWPGRLGGFAPAVLIKWQQLQEAQQRMWELAREVEEMIDFEIDTTIDLSDHDLADMRERGRSGRGISGR